MRAAILGADGQLGRALAERFGAATPLRRADLDISDPAAVQAFAWDGFDTVLNAAAYTRVDEAETPAGRRLAWRANAEGPRNLARAALEHELTLVHVSTDYVFDGTAAAHRETEEMSPLGVYGQSKAAGDLAVALAPRHYVLRVSWLVGDGANFVRSMSQRARQGAPASIVGDQVGRLTFTAQAVAAIGLLLSARADFGTYHCSNDGDAVSWAEIARAVYAARGRSPDLVTEVDTADYQRTRPGSAPRPRSSVLDLAKIRGVGLKPADWRSELTGYLRREGS